jgi:hypothetical protein
MHARNRTWLLGSDPVERCRQRTLPVEGGDGSTLSLDFTTGVLDPRLSFTRTTNATFINSQGLVEFAAANILRNSVMAGGSTSGLSAPTSWVAGFTGESYRTQMVIDGCEQWKQVASSTRPYMTITIPNTELAVGVQYVASVYVDSLTTGTLFATLDNFLSYNEPSGTTVSSVTWVAPNGSTGASQPLAIGRIQLRFVLSAIGASGFQLRIGIGVQNTATGTVEFSRPQCERGTVAKPFLANTSTSAANYNTPRFDYDPTSIGTPRGLLIEGSASNLLKHSQGLFTSWIQFGTVGALTTGITSPSGDSSAVSLNLNTAGNNGYYTNNTQMGYTNTVGATYTFSIWVRATGSTTNLNIRFGDSAVGYSANIPITTSWQRLQYSYVAVAASGPTIASATGTATGVVELWGAQLEAGSGASSYIPTGASTGSRAADFCTMSSIGSWFNEPSGTFVSKVTYTALSGDNSGIEISVGTGASASNRIGIRKGYVDYYSGGSQSAEMYPTVTSGNVRIATAYSALDFAMCSNGGTMRTDSTGAVPVGLNTLKLYSDAGTSNTLCLFGWVSSIKYWPTRLPNAQLQALTT